MKNLFDYATKELSQDAFLRWLFESWKEDIECGIIVRKMLMTFCGFEGEIEDIRAKAQEQNIDIKVEIKPINGDEIFLFIEDKTFSNEHKQLIEYDKYINNNFLYAYKIFYKTNRINEDDDKGIDEANKINRKDNKSQWQKWDIDKIIGLFKRDEPYQNLILQNYLGHIEKIKKGIDNREKPKTNDNKIDLLKWEAYFNNSIIPKLKQAGYKAFPWKGQYPYICLMINKEGFEKNAPYLEIRSRDCINDGFMARVLCYGIADEELMKQQPRLISNIKKSSFSCKGLVTKRRGKTIFPKQVGYTDKLFVGTTEEFLFQLEFYIKEFLEVMKNWQ